MPTNKSNNIPLFYEYASCIESIYTAQHVNADVSYIFSRASISQKVESLENRTGGLSVSEPGSHPLDYNWPTRMEQKQIQLNQKQYVQHFHTIVST